MKKELITILKKIKEIEHNQNTYLDSVPSDISTVVFDNEYANMNGLKFDIVLQALFGDYVDEVYWFLYEFKPGKIHGPHITFDKKEYTFKDEQDYYDYLETLP
jgi:hypothetical protein